MTVVCLEFHASLSKVLEKTTASRHVMSKLMLEFCEQSKVCTTLRLQQ